MKEMRDFSQPRVVAIGGGTGLSTMLRGLKRFTSRITAIVTVADDGGGSGVLRQELGMLPPGDIRNCICALANVEPTMDELMRYRFSEGRLSGQSMGNLMLAALNGIYGSCEEAVRRMSEVFAITGRVLPVTTENVRLMAEFDDGSTVIGESKIAGVKKDTDQRIRRVQLLPERPPAVPAVLEAIEEADFIIIGPGSLYTSIMPNLITDGVAAAIARSDAVKLYIMNVMTQDGETEGYTEVDHVRALFDHSGEKLFDLSLANNMPFPEEILQANAAEGAEPVKQCPEEQRNMGVTPHYAPLARISGGLIRHNPDALAREALWLYRAYAQTQVYG